MAPPSTQPVLGSAALDMYNPTSIRVTETTCHQLSLFKDIMKEYRKMDDSITMRLNRNNARFRDRDRLSGRHTPNQDEACAYFWAELVANWKGRNEVIEYCVAVVDNTVNEKKKLIAGQEAGLDDDVKLRSSLYSDDVKRNQIHNELTVEAIVRRRSWEAFSSRCKHFEPPRSDTEARRWWDAAVAASHVR